jgi:ADP-heptose:LPS heptosyltransferase
MGLGDEIMATGIAKRLYKETGKKVAFGHNGRPVFNQDSSLIFKNNPKIVQPGESTDGVVWSDFVRGNRQYFKGVSGGKMQWNADFKAEAGEFYFTEEDKITFPEQPFIVVEPNTKQTVSSDNKQWPIENMQWVVDNIDIPVIQFDYGKRLLNGVLPVKTRNIRESAYILKHSELIISMEGGLHHAAAAVGCKAVVLFSGYISPKITGYDFHENIFKADTVCGSLKSCNHCRDSLLKISKEEVLREVKKLL